MADVLFITICVALFGSLFTFILTSSHYTSKSQRMKWKMEDKHNDALNKLRDQMRDERQKYREAREEQRKEAARAERVRNIEDRLKSIESRLSARPNRSRDVRPVASRNAVPSGSV